MNISDYHITIGNNTDVGKVREHNEDYMAHFATPIGYCVIICDGMGGHAAGEVAAQNAIVAIQQFLQDTKNESSDVPVALKNAIEFANYQLREMVNQDPGLKGMGTTCALALIADGQLYTAHAGDSRIYLLREGMIKQITKDHSSVQKLIDSGVLTEEEAELSDKKNEIHKAIGIFDKVDPAITVKPFELQEDDKLLLCSDGLTAHVPKEIILETVQSMDDIQKAVLKLTEQANSRGGSDNITVQLIQYMGKTKPEKRKLSRNKIVASFILIVTVIGFSFWIYMKNYGFGKSAKTPVNIDTGLNKSKNLPIITPIPTESKNSPAKK